MVKKKKSCIVKFNIALLLVAFCLFFAACELGDYNGFSYELQGTWVSTTIVPFTNNSPYGGLIITFDTITITGYSPEYTMYLSFPDSQRPFKDFTREIPRKSYSEGTISTSGFGTRVGN